MRLFLSNLKLSRWGMVAWGLGLLAYAYLMVSLYPSFKQTAGSVWMEYLESMPEPLKVLIAGGESDFTSLFQAGFMKLDVFLNVEFLSWWPVFVAIYAVFFGSGLVAKEMEQGTLELLLSHPVRRYRLLLSKFGVFLVGLLAMAVAALAGVWLGLVTIGDEIGYLALLLALVQGSLLLAFIGSYSTFFSCLFLEPRRALTASGTITAGLYILNFAAPLLDSWAWVQRLSPFYYFQPLRILQDAQLYYPGVAVYLLGTAASLALAVFVFQRRELVT